MAEGGGGLSRLASPVCAWSLTRPSVLPICIHNTWGLKRDHPDQRNVLFILLIFMGMFIPIRGLRLTLTRGVLDNSEKDCSETLLAMPDNNTTETLTLSIPVFLLVCFLLVCFHSSLATAPLLFSVPHMQQCCLVDQRNMEIYTAQLVSTHMFVDLLFIFRRF